MDSSYIWLWVTYLENGGFMLNDITVILIHYSDQAALHKAFTSLQNFSSRLKSIIVLQEGKKSLHSINRCDLSGRVQYITIKDNNLGKTLRDRKSVV